MVNEMLEVFKKKSSRFESKGFLFDPLPLVRVGTEYEIGDVRSIADLIMNSLNDGKISEKKGFARILLETLIFDVLYYQDSKALSDVEHMLSLFTYEGDQMIEAIKAHTMRWKLDRWCDFITNEPTDSHPEILHNCMILRSVKQNNLGLCALLAMNAIRKYRLSGSIPAVKGACVCGAEKFNFLKEYKGIL